MQKPKIIDAEFTVIESCKTLVPLARSVRRLNWLQIARIVYDELWDAFWDPPPASDPQGPWPANRSAGPVPMMIGREGGQ